MSIEERLAALESQSNKPAEKRKDVWDIMSAIGGLLIPAAIFLVGQQYAREMARAQIASEEARSASSTEVSRAGARVSQASLVLSALETLAGEDGPKKRLAIQAILIALPDDGRRLIEVVSLTDPSEEIRAYASDSLAEQKKLLAGRLFASQPQVRGDAAAQLLQAWKGDSSLVPILAESARRAFADRSFPGRENGIYNVLVVLSQMDPAALAPHRRDLVNLANEMRPIGNKTSERSDKLISRLPR